VREASAGVQQLDRAITASQQTARGEIGRISIGYVTSAALTGVLTRVLDKFRVHHPEVTVRLTAMDTPSQLAALHDGALDVGFLRPRTIYPAGIIARIVHREAMLLALCTNHPLIAKRFELKHLARETFIIPQFDENTGFAEQLAQLAADGGFEPKNTVHVQDFLTAITLAASGYGVVPVPKCMLSITMRNLQFRAIHGYRGSAELAAAYNPRNASLAVQAFVRDLPVNETAYR
jgi:DNA-binding transcriptional LysR family regulator